MTSTFTRKTFWPTRYCSIKFAITALCCISMGFLCSIAFAQDSTNVKEVSRDAPTVNSSVDASVHADVVERHDDPDPVGEPVKQTKSSSTRWNYTRAEDHPTTQFWPAHAPSVGDLAAPDPGNSRDSSKPAPASFRAGGQPPELSTSESSSTITAAPFKTGEISQRHDDATHRSYGKSPELANGLSNPNQFPKPDSTSGFQQSRDSSAFSASSDRALGKNNFHFPESTTFNPGQNFPRPVTAGRIEPTKHTHAHKNAGPKPSDKMEGFSVNDAKRSAARKTATE